MARYRKAGLSAVGEDDDRFVGEPLDAIIARMSSTLIPVPSVGCAAAEFIGAAEVGTGDDTDAVAVAVVAVVAGGMVCNASGDTVYGDAGGIVVAGGDVLLLLVLLVEVVEISTDFH
tara:strand:- start:57 stop:407 length:351 start_codon:yes stop_codon:yes gene_type:complete